MSGHASVTLDSSDFNSGCVPAVEAEAKLRQEETGDLVRVLKEHRDAETKRLFENIVVILQLPTETAAERVWWLAAVCL